MFTFEKGAKKFEEGARELLKHYPKEAQKSEITVDYAEATDNEVSLSFDGKKAVIKGHMKVNFYRMFCTLAQHVAASNKPFEVKESFVFKTFGNMVDCSRNSVLSVEGAKNYIRFLASSGMNMMMLYTEDTYEIPGEPYFGAFRGRYSQEELKEIDDYADMLGVEVIPCIQTLAHLAAMLKWSVYKDLKDTDDILLVENEETYKFVEKAIRTVSSCLRSRRVHVGMDEAMNLGLGNYLKKNGLKDRRKLMMDHITRVQKICESMGLETIIWSDMFFRLLSPTGSYYSIPDDVKTFPFSFSDKCHLTYWDYYHNDYNHYKRFLSLHLDADKDCYFAGGGWTWCGVCPNYEKAFSTTDPAIKACRELKINHVFCTTWQDNGAETSQSAGLPSVLYFAELGYRDEVDMKLFSDRLLFLTGIPFEAYELMGNMDKVALRSPDSPDKDVTKYALYNDPMIGMFDAHVADLKGIGEHYAKIAEAFKKLKYKNDLTEYYGELSAAMVVKAELGLNIVAAYKNGDKKALKEIAKDRIPDCIKHLEKARQARENIWLSESKPDGFEVYDIRVNGVIGRLGFAKRRIEAYLDGRTDSLPELMEERIYAHPHDAGRVTNDNNWVRIASASPF